MKAELTKAIKLLNSGYKRVEITVSINGKKYNVTCYKVPGVGSEVIRIDLREIKDELH